MKKLKCLALICLMMIALVGCGSKDASAMKVEGEFNVYTRDASSGTREAFEKGVGFEGQLLKTAIEVSGNDDMASKVGSSVNGIGYTSLSTDFEKNHIKALKFEGVSANSSTILDGSYGLQRPFMFVTRASHDFDSKEKAELVKAFLDFLQNSTEGMTIVSKAGGVVDLEQSVPWEQLACKYPQLQKDNSSITITTCGSTSVEKSVKAALEAFSPLAGNVQFIMNQNGSSDAVVRVLGSEANGANKADIGFASRKFKEDGSEDIAKAMVSGRYCIDAVVCVVHQDNPIDDISKEQLKQVFTGKLKTWEDLV